jgi:hypothetical protein
MGSDWKFGTVLRHSQVAALVMFVCAGSAPDWWWGMWIGGNASGKVVLFSGRASETPMWLVAA